MTVVDTSVWIDFFAGQQNAQTNWLRSVDIRNEVGVPDLVLCEVLQGVRQESRVAAIQRELAKLISSRAQGNPSRSKRLLTIVC